MTRPCIANLPVDCFVGDACMPPPWAAGDDQNEPGADSAIFPSDPSAYWCIPGPTRCNCPGVFEPVCGGDGRNYINACEAACAGVGIRHEGYCDEPPGEGCVRAGCSGQLCVEEGMDIASTCEWRPVYECYQQASCERQPNGQCGFTPTYELVECLERFGEGMCRVDPRWQDGFEAECESPQVPGITGILAVSPHEMMRLGEPFGASFQLLDPPIFNDVYFGEGLLVCDGERTSFEGFVMMTPLGDLEVQCRILPETDPGECLDDSDCPPGHYCERFGGWPDDGVIDPSIPEPPPPGMCIDLCALIDCAPGYVCELGECIPQHPFCESDYDCPVDWICQEGILGAPQPGGACERCACLDIYVPSLLASTDEPMAMAARRAVRTFASRTRASARTTVPLKRTSETSKASACRSATGPSSAATSNAAMPRRCAYRIRLVRSATSAWAGACRRPATAGPTAAKQAGPATTARRPTDRRSGSAFRRTQGLAYLRTNAARPAATVKSVRTKTWRLLVSRCPSSPVTERSAFVKSSPGDSAAGLRPPSSTSAFHSSIVAPPAAATASTAGTAGSVGSASPRAPSAEVLTYRTSNRLPDGLTITVRRAARFRPPWSPSWQ